MYNTNMSKIISLILNSVLKQLGKKTIIQTIIAANKSKKALYLLIKELGKKKFFEMFPFSKQIFKLLSKEITMIEILQKQGASFLKGLIPSELKRLLRLKDIIKNEENNIYQKILKASLTMNNNQLIAFINRTYEQHLMIIRRKIKEDITKAKKALEERIKEANKIRREEERFRRQKAKEDLRKAKKDLEERIRENNKKIQQQLKDRSKKISQNLSLANKALQERIRENERIRKETILEQRRQVREIISEEVGNIGRKYLDRYQVKDFPRKQEEKITTNWKTFNQFLDNLPPNLRSTFATYSEQDDAFTSSEGRTQEFRNRKSKAITRMNWTPYIDSFFKGNEDFKTYSEQDTKDKERNWRKREIPPSMLGFLQVYFRKNPKRKNGKNKPRKVFYTFVNVPYRDFKRFKKAPSLGQAFWLWYKRKRKSPRHLTTKSKYAKTKTGKIKKSFTKKVDKRPIVRPYSKARKNRINQAKKRK